MPKSTCSCVTALSRSPALNLVRSLSSSVNVTSTSSTNTLESIQPNTTSKSTTSPSSNSGSNPPTIVDATLSDERSSAPTSLELDAGHDERVHNPSLEQVLKKAAATAYVANEVPLTQEGKDALEKRFLIQAAQHSRPGSDLNERVVVRAGVANRRFLEGPSSAASAAASKNPFAKAAPLVRVQHARSDAQAYKTPTQQLYEDYLTIRPTLDSFESLVDEQIARARRQGQFDELSGRGKPLPLNSDERLNVHLSDTELIMNRMLKSQNALPGWIEVGKEVDQEVANLRRELHEIAHECLKAAKTLSHMNWSAQSGRNAYTSFGLGALSSWLIGDAVDPATKKAGGNSPSTLTPQDLMAREAEWKRRGTEWAKKRITQINVRVRDYNLQSPGTATKKRMLVVDEEMARAIKKSDSVPAR